MKLNFSEPKIYTGGVLISDWSKLTKSEQKTALSRDWFIYYSFQKSENFKIKTSALYKSRRKQIKDKKGTNGFFKDNERSLIETLTSRI